MQMRLSKSVVEDCCLHCLQLILSFFLKFIFAQLSADIYFHSIDLHSKMIIIDCLIGIERRVWRISLFVRLLIFILFEYFDGLVYLILIQSSSDG